MGLTSALQIGRTALNASSLALQVTGNNLANAADPRYARRLVSMAPLGGYDTGRGIVGLGVGITGINRRIDGAIQSRLYASTSDFSYANTELALLSSVETTLNELSDNDLSSEMSRFFNNWSELANSPDASGTRSIVIEQGRTLSAYMRDLRSDLSSLRGQIDSQIAASVEHADGLLSELATVNQAVVSAEAGTATANSLRDQRDAVLAELSELMDITTIEQDSGAVDVLVGSTPLLLRGVSLGMQLRTESNSNGFQMYVEVGNDGETIDIESGSIGALMDRREGLNNDTIARLDDIASQLIHQVNRIHSTGYSSSPMTSVTGTRKINTADISRALNDPDNASLAGLPFAIENGSFVITVANERTHASESVRIDIDLDGLETGNLAGFSDDTSIQDIVQQIDAVAGVSASVNPDGTISIDAADGTSFSFSDDSSGALAVLGINTFFQGETALDITIRDELSQQPGLLNAGRLDLSGQSDNASALAIALLQDQTNTKLGGQTLREAWLSNVQTVASRTAAASTKAQAGGLVKASLEAQRAGISGVSIDEESINLITYQQQYQSAARYIATVDELNDVLLSIL